MLPRLAALPKWLDDNELDGRPTTGLKYPDHLRVTCRLVDSFNLMENRCEVVSLQTTTQRGLLQASLLAYNQSNLLSSFLWPLAAH